MPHSEDLLPRGLQELGLPSTGPLAQALERYIALIELWNPAYGLVGASGDELVVKHILDSLAPLSIIRGLLDAAPAVSLGEAPGHGADTTPGHGADTTPERAIAVASGQGRRIADLGTGAGLPGIPLALALPDAEVHLIDRMTRRIRFLELARSELPLPNAEVIEEQVERAKGTYDLVLFRAFKPFERKLFKRVFALCETEGAVLAYKGKADKVRTELAAIEGLYASAEILPVKVPFLEDERCVVLLRPARPKLAKDGRFL